MTQEQKQLLLKDLCARLPYKPIVQIDDCGIWNLRGIDHDDSAELRDRVIVWHGENYPSSKNSFPIINCKPYLFPLSSMTEEQSIELFKLFGISLVDSIGADYIKINECTGITFFLDKGFDIETHLDKLIDWLNKNHFDYRGLIPMGMAIDATYKNIY